MDDKVYLLPVDWTIRVQVRELENQSGQSLTSGHLTGACRPARVPIAPAGFSFGPLTAVDHHGVYYAVPRAVVVDSNVGADGRHYVRAETCGPFGPTEAGVEAAPGA